MLVLLLMLTGINFFLYGSKDPGKNAIASMVAGMDEDAASPSGPDEKAPGTPVSVIEEYLYAGIRFHSFRTHTSFLLPIAGTEKVQRGHCPLFSPPPEA